MLRVDYAGLGKRIREQRQRLGITQAQLAEQSNLSQQYIGFLENGQRQPSLETIITLCYVLDAPVEYLLQDSLPESLFTHYSSNSSGYTLRSVMGTLRNTLTDLLVPPERPHFIPPDAPATEEQLARIPFGYLDPPKPRRPRKKKQPATPESAEEQAQEKSASKPRKSRAKTPFPESPKEPPAPKKRTKKAEA